jgi:predicted AlkP superfamily phosphohydrolase/phosphomutase
MTRKEISQMIEKEINGDWTITNRHNSDLKKCLIRPKRRKLKYGNEIKDYWIVLEEHIRQLSKIISFQRSRYRIKLHRVSV